MAKRNNNKKSTGTSPEVSSAVVRLAHRIHSTSSKTQYVKIGDIFYKVKELG